MKHLAIVVIRFTLVFAVMLALASRSMAGAPNMMANSSFEGGDGMFTLQKAFHAVKDRANAHSGDWELVANLSQTYGNAFQPFDCWKDTSYTTSIWLKGSGSVTLEVLSSDRKTVLAGAPLTATASWRKAGITWNSGNSISAIVALCDNVGNGTMYLDDISTALTAGKTISFNALRPDRSTPKFHLLFDDEFSSSKTIDVNDTGAGGYNWYLHSFFGDQYDNNSSMFSVNDGVLTLKDCGNDWGEVLDTAHPAKNGQGFIGTVFSAGKGLYLEAKIALVSKKSAAGWWSFDMKGETKLNQTMPGNPGHREYIENDFLEYDPRWKDPPNDWLSTMHDWCDANLANSVNNLVPEPVDTDFTQYHTYGVLMVPATAANDWIGYRQAYFDGMPEQAVCWKGNQTYTAGVFPETNASMGSYLFSLADHDQFQLILGGPKGGTPYMKVEYVRVYAVDKSSMTVVKP